MKGGAAPLAGRKTCASFKLFAGELKPCSTCTSNGEIIKSSGNGSCVADEEEVLDLAI